jgi:CDP-4-dehydro-6-deoxyglucose reductase
MSHSVRLHPGGERFDAEPDEPVLMAGLRAGLHLPHSCRGGSCGACEAAVLSGTLHYPRGRPTGIRPEAAERGRVLLCQAHATSDVVLEARAIAVPAEVRIRRLPCRVEDKRLLSHDVMQLVLKLPAIEPFVFLPGQYIDILLEDGRRRSFSMANPPHESERLELHIRRVADGDFTARVFESLAVRTLLRLEGPLGGFWLREGDDRPALFVGGGTGYAPLKSMLRHLISTGAQRSVHLYWGVREPRDLYDGEQVQAWAADHPWLTFTPVASHGAAGWGGRDGLVHEAVIADYPDMSGCDVYAAGPPAMIQAMQDEFPAHGLPPGHLYFDSFEFGPDRILIPAAPAGGAR